MQKLRLSLGLFSIFLALLSVLKAIRDLFQLYTNHILGRGKDFDIYYPPIFLIHIYWAADFFFVALSAILGDETQEICNTSLVLFAHFLVGVCRLQIALNWAEIAGKGFISAKQFETVR